MFDTTKLLAVGLVVLLSMGGAVAAGTGSLGASSMADTTSSSGAGPADVDAAVTYENDTAMFVATANGTGVENLTVYANDEKVGTTGENGTVTFDASNATHEDEHEIEVEFIGDHVEGELEYERHDGSLMLVEEKVEYERPDVDEKEDETEDEAEEEDAESEDETETEDEQPEQEGDDAESEDDDAESEDDEDEEEDNEQEDEETEDEQSEN